MFHNRLTHTLEVAQLARRIAERLLRDHGELIERFGGLDPEAVEAAALAHDLGHPPFGHVAEKELDRLVIEAGDDDGFEGNAQSFRIVTRLAAHREDYRGLNLSRATLRGVLKYPWFHGQNTEEKRKFGAYRSDEQSFAFARKGFEGKQQFAKALEAQIMDYADAVTYSVHDLDDFYRAGLVPLERLKSDFEAIVARFRDAGKVSSEAIDRHKDALYSLLVVLPVERRYAGTYEERVQLRTASSWLINEFVSGLELQAGTDALRLSIPEDKEVRARFLQKLVWDFVITSPRLASQQHGQRQIIRTLFEIYLGAVRQRSNAVLLDGALVPAPFMTQARELPAAGTPGAASAEARLACDIVASFTDTQATMLYRRLTGVAQGSVTDLLDG